MMETKSLLKFYIKLNYLNILIIAAVKPWLIFSYITLNKAYSSDCFSFGTCNTPNKYKAYSL